MIASKKRRNVFSSICALTAVLCTSNTLANTERPTASTTMPNIVLIMADDLGYADVGFHDQRTDVRTPNLDKLALSGTVFSAGYVTAPVCGPSRAGMLTGRYQQRFGAHDNIGPYVLSPDIEQGVPADIPTMGHYLGQAGYQTALIGKWHDGDAPQFWPHKRGFNTFFGFNNGAADYFVGQFNQENAKHAPYSSIYRNDELLTPFPDYLTDKFGDEAVRFIESNTDTPFFLYLSFNAIHGPLQALQADLDQFAGNADEQRQLALAMNVNMDRNIGKVMTALELHQLDTNTLIVFLSDNGGKSTGVHRNASYNTPLNGEKGTLLDGGIRVPFFIRWPGVIPAGTTINEPIISLDLLPTLLAAAGQPAPKTLEGQNLLPRLLGQQATLDNRYIYWSMPRQAAIRDHEWKLLIHKNPNQPDHYQLFNIKNDIGETTDLAARHPERVSTLLNAYQHWDANNQRQQWGWDPQTLPFKSSWRQQ